jgi:hypothetical protein
MEKKKRIHINSPIPRYFHIIKLHFHIKTGQEDGKEVSRKMTIYLQVEFLSPVIPIFSSIVGNERKNNQNLKTI